MLTCLPSSRTSGSRPIERSREPRVHPVTEELVGIGDRRGHRISVQLDLRSKRKSLRFCLLHHPAQWCLGEKVGLVATANVGVGAHEPALLDAGERSRLGDDGLRIFWMADIPEGGNKVVPMLIDSERVISVQDGKTQSGLQVIERRTADARHIPCRQADRPNSVPDANHLDLRGLGVLEKPSLLLRQLGDAASRFLILQSPNTFLVTFPIALEELADAYGRPSLKDAIDGDQSSQGSCGVCAAAEAENVDLVAVVLIFYEPLVGQPDVLIEPLSEHPTEKTVHSDRVVDELRLSVSPFRGAQGPHPPDIRVAIDTIPRPIEKDRQTLLLLLSTGEVRLIAAFLRRAADNHADRDDCDNTQEKGHPVREPFKTSPNPHKPLHAC